MLKNEESTMSCEVQAVLFNSDILSKIIPYLPSIDLLSLALTCTRFGSHNDDDSLIKESARILVKEIATEDELATLPYYNGNNSLADYHYLQFMRGPLTFDQLIGNIKYVKQHYYITMSESEYRVKKENKSCVRHSDDPREWETAFSNNVMKAGKHYAAFEISVPTNNIILGLMRPGKANQNAKGTPLYSKFFRNFSRLGTEEERNKVQCCVYNARNGSCYTSDWSGSDSPDRHDWEGSESMSMYRVEMGLLLDLDEGTLSVYNNGRKLGVMKSGLAGPYCWVASIYRGSQVTIKRGIIPPN